ncbi:MAG: hypothetical protein Q4P78_08240 [Rothia sp. (in: high G+C Gram-positive bacteria)]|uniref:hypothetical protein n=1 Tax=Rothia sp. (in: high G+C Gram-positive bacteria) TaxID=1885016 RepID=UPI0026E09703|nr:hypothetical protein [Rothia sp. (in: high G+C Gram-positive bacteria)]MDO5751165.1 hypothetical protein [Rothia sp. (in: high G+C Gram-positive bacteria)]
MSNHPAFVFLKAYRPEGYERRAAQADVSGSSAVQPQTTQNVPSVLADGSAPVRKVEWDPPAKQSTPVQKSTAQEPEHPPVRKVEWRPPASARQGAAVKAPNLARAATSISASATTSAPAAAPATAQAPVRTAQNFAIPFDPPAKISPTKSEAVDTLQSSPPGALLYRLTSLQSALGGIEIIGENIFTAASFWNEPLGAARPLDFTVRADSPSVNPARTELSIPPRSLANLRSLRISGHHLRLSNRALNLVTEPVKDLLILSDQHQTACTVVVIH